MLKTILKKKKRTDRTLGQMLKAKLDRQITQRSILTHTQKKRKRKIYIYIYTFKKKEESNQINKHIYQ